MSEGQQRQFTLNFYSIVSYTTKLLRHWSLVGFKILRGNLPNPKGVQEQLSTPLGFRINHEEVVVHPKCNENGVYTIDIIYKSTVPRLSVLISVRNDNVPIYLVLS